MVARRGKVPTRGQTLQGARSRVRADAAIREDEDINASIAGLLLDLSALQEGPRALAYKRAAHAVLGLAQPVSSLRNGPGLAKIPYVGPSSERVILE